MGDLNKWADLFGLYDTVIFSKEKVIKQVTIKMQGSRDWDFREANKKSKILGKRGKATINAHREVYGEVTWHHATYNPDDNTAVMQLVKRADHEASLPHEGSVSQFEQKTGFKYESDEAKDAAKKLNLNSAAFFLVRRFYMLRCLFGALYVVMRIFGASWVLPRHEIPHPNQWGI